MFKFITKKYEDRIKSLERQIEYMTWEWNKEKTHYSEIKEDLIWAIR